MGMQAQASVVGVQHAQRAGYGAQLRVNAAEGGQGVAGARHQQRMNPVRWLAQGRQRRSAGSVKVSRKQGAGVLALAALPEGGVLAAGVVAGFAGPAPGLGFGQAGGVACG